MEETTQIKLTSAMKTAIVAIILFFALLALPFFDVEGITSMLSGSVFILAMSLATIVVPLKFKSFFFEKTMENSKLSMPELFRYGLMLIAAVVMGAVAIALAAYSFERYTTTDMINATQLSKATHVQMYGKYYTIASCFFPIAFTSAIFFPVFFFDYIKNRDNWSVKLASKAFEKKYSPSVTLRLAWITVISVTLILLVVTYFSTRYFVMVNFRIFIESDAWKEMVISLSN